MKIKAALLLISLALGLAAPGCKKKSDDSASPSAGGVGSTASTVRPGEAAELKARWPVGARFAQRLEIAQNSDTVVPNMPQPMKQGMTMGQDVSLDVVKETAGGGREIDMRIGDIAMSVFQGEREVIGFDSKGETVGDDRNPIGEAFRGLVGGRLKYFIDSSNRVERIEGWKELVDAMSDKLKGPGRAVLGSMLKEDYFRQMADFGHSLPGRAVKPGESWPSKTDVVMGPIGSISIETIYTFKGWDQRDNKRMALLESTGTITGKGDQGAGPMGMSMTIDAGKMTGKSWFDPVRSQVVESIIDQDMTLRVKVPARPSPGGPGASGEMTLTNRMNQKISFKLTPAGA